MPPKVFYLIDDDEDEQYVFELALEDLDKSAKLIWQPNGEQAIKDLADLSIQPDYIFIDINMPRISGWECLGKIRELPRFGETPIAMYSTSASQSFRMNEIHAALVSACIDKKSSIAELSATLGAFIERYQ